MPRPKAEALFSGSRDWCGRASARASGIVSQTLRSGGAESYRATGLDSFGPVTQGKKPGARFFGDECGDDPGGGPARGPLSASQPGPETATECAGRSTLSTMLSRSRTVARGVDEADADLALARRALAGVPEARSELVRRLVCVPRMLAALNARWGRPLDSHDLDDLGQDVLVALWRGLPSFAGLSSLESWAFRSCHRALLHRLRRRRVASEDVDRLPAAPEPLFDELYRALEQLEPRGRRMVQLKHFEGLTFEEIGEHLSASPNTVKGWYYETLTTLRRILAAARREDRS